MGRRRKSSIGCGGMLLISLLTLIKGIFFSKKDTSDKNKLREIYNKCQKGTSTNT